MSLIITTYVPEGIVMTSDSRQSVNVKGRDPEGKEFETDTINSDAVNKTFLLEKYGVGISNFGQDLLGGIPMASHIKRFIEEELTDSDDINSIPEKLVRYFRNSFPSADTGFHVVGYEKKGEISIPYVYYCHVSKGILERKNVKSDGKLAYGATWSGQIDVLASIINPVIAKDERGTDKIIRMPAPIIWDAMSLQDSVNFSIYAIRTTIDIMRFQARPKNVGGPIDVLVITPDEARWIQQKELTGEKEKNNI